MALLAVKAKPAPVGENRLVDDQRKERIASNEAQFREINERLSAGAAAGTG